MSINKKVLKLRQSILKANTQLDQIKESGMLETSEEANVRYNRILIEKAICRKELNESNYTLFEKIMKKFTAKMGHQEQLICDYFK